jgi:hypothetical protein
MKMQHQNCFGSSSDRQTRIVEQIADYALLLQTGTVDDIIGANIQHLKECFQRVATLVDGAQFPLEDAALEQDRLEFLRQCAKSHQRIINAAKGLGKVLQAPTLTRQSAIKGFEVCHRKCGDAQLDVASVWIVRLKKAVQRQNVGPNYDDQFREQERAAEEGKKATQELQELRALIHNNLKSQCQEYTVKDIQRATGLATRQAVIYHLESLSRRGRIQPKENRLADWKLSLKDFTEAISYIKAASRQK